MYINKIITSIYCYIFIVFNGLCFSIESLAGEVYSEFPQQINANEKYVFYTHGLLLEGQNVKPEHERWGVYDFLAVKKALSDPQYNLIAYHRPKHTIANQFAEKLATDVKTLLDHGVKPENITLLGFSRGGEITLLANSKLRQDKVNTILLAVCGDYVKGHEEFQPYGNLFSIYETSDFAGSCEYLQDRTRQLNSFIEKSINTGKEHGAFYQPLPQWLDQVKRWILSIPDK